MRTRLLARTCRARAFGEMIDAHQQKVLFHQQPDDGRQFRETQPGGLLQFIEGKVAAVLFNSGQHGECCRVFIFHIFLFYELSDSSFVLVFNTLTPSNRSVFAPLPAP